MHAIARAALTGAALLCHAVPGAPAGAQRAPAAPELFGVGVFSTGDYELPPTFDVGGARAWFTVSTPAYGRMRVIMETTRAGAGWSTPRVAAFSGRYDDADPYVSPDGEWLYFTSTRGAFDRRPGAIVRIRRDELRKTNGIGRMVRIS